MKYIYVLLLGAIGLPAAAQELQPIWVQTELNDGSSGFGQNFPIIVTDVAQNIFMCGDTYQPGPGIGFAISKYDPQGNLLWHKEYQTNVNDIITAAVTDIEGSVYVGGNSFNLSTGQPSSLLFKYSSDGDLLWSYAYANGTARSFDLSALLWTPEQDLLVIAAFTDPPQNNAGLLVSRIHPSGQVVWEKTFDEGDFGYAALDAVMTDEGYVIWGTRGSNEGLRFFCWQIDWGGQTLETASTEPYTDDFLVYTHLDSKGSLYIGDFYGEYKVTKFNCIGDMEWEYNKPVLLPDPNGIHARLYCMQTDNHGNLFTSGIYHDQTLGMTGLTTKLDSTGIKIWEHFIPDLEYGSLYPKHSTILENGVFVITGDMSTNLDSNYYQFFLAAYDSIGLKQSAYTTLPGPRNSSSSIYYDGHHIYIAGISFPISFLDPTSHFLCKYPLSALSATSVPSSLPVFDLPLHPNPFRDELWLDLPPDAGGGQVSCLDARGKTVWRNDVLLSANGPVKLSGLGKLSPGIYVILAETEQGRYIGKAVKTTEP